jgi:hypothetical protein
MNNICKKEEIKKEDITREDITRDEIKRDEITRDEDIMELNLLCNLIHEYRPDITTREECLEAIQKYVKEINSETIVENTFIVNDFKCEMLTTFVPVIDIIGIYKDYSTFICDNIKVELNHLLSCSNKLIILIKKIVLFLKIVVNKPYIDYNVSECIHYFLYIRTTFDPNTKLIISHFNYGNTILYKIIILYFREYNIIIDHPLEFDNLINNKKAKLIISIAQKNLDRRVNICKYTCSQCNKISFEDILQNCACGDVQFCSQVCLNIAWPTHKKTCSTYLKNRCFKCNKLSPSKKLLKLCSSCKGVKYCSKSCQVGDWPMHKQNCLVKIV